MEPTQMIDMAAAGSKLLEVGGVMGAVILIQLGIIVWLIKRLLDALERNSKAFERLTSMLDDRPCLHGGSALKTTTQER